MQKILSAVFLILILSANLAFADEVTTSIIQRAPGKIECDHERRSCSYVSQNITARELIAKINANLFPGSILSPSEGFITADGLKKINFYINAEELRNRLIAAIPFLDTLEEFDPSDLVMLTTDIYTLTEGGLTNIQASLVTANDPTSEIAEWVISSALGGPTGMALKIGTNLLSSLLGSSKVKEESSKVTTINQLIPNQAGINYSNTSKVYIAPPGSGVVKEESAGLVVGGTVSISARDNDLVLIKDYNLTYGVIEAITAGERVNILSISNPQLYLVKGTSSLVVSSVTIDESKKTEYSALSWGKKKGQSLNKIMIVTRAEAVNFKDFIAEMKKMRQIDLHQQFTKEEINKLPKTDVDMRTVLEHIIPLSYFTTSGDRVLGFRLDAKDARANNISKNIEVTVKSGGLFSSGIKQKVILPLENLMLSGLKFNPLSLKELKKKEVEIDVTLKLYNSEETVTKTLHYNPETNKFFE
ncbi:MAG: hypothetical protein WC635_02365 [Bacteriovorax sp.]|jgi:hypothetical protein